MTLRNTVFVLLLGFYSTCPAMDVSEPDLYLADSKFTPEEMRELVEVLIEQRVIEVKNGYLYLLRPTALGQLCAMKRVKNGVSRVSSVCL